MQVTRLPQIFERMRTANVDTPFILASYFPARLAAFVYFGVQPVRKGPLYFLMAPATAQNKPKDSVNY